MSNVLWNVYFSTVRALPLPARVRCRLDVHVFDVEWEPLPGHRKIRCYHCGALFAMNDELEIVVPWDAEFEWLYRSLLACSRSEAS